ncbi:TetR/AcrR family transcriptional regulator [Ornithinicoccus halotolerans]|uniref:TetR/AcrR family transcriptional regulator n=1 Tax=Ornithinicoccus halotolerans TaxID=1748220 RepID=UPI001296E956|nr:TetR/AcrR family transcriptional regulator [Ornithinicoccus halotolerans]
MTEAATRERVLQVARRLFGERGYAAVTIREVAAEAGISPAMVMKVAGSKEQLYADATPLEPAPLDAGRPIAGMGPLLVRRMLDRRDQEVAEPWLRALYLLHGAPDPDAARREFRERFLSRFAGADLERRHRADLAACMLIGLAAGIRSFRLLPPEEVDPEQVVAEYGPLVQQLLDGLTAPGTELPAPPRVDDEEPSPGS